MKRIGIFMLLIVLLCGCRAEEKGESIKSSNNAVYEADEEKASEIEDNSEGKIEYYDFSFEAKLMHVERAVEGENEADYYLKANSEHNKVGSCEIHIVKGVEFISNVEEAETYFEQFGQCDEMLLYTGINEYDSQVKDMMIGRNEEESYYLIRYENESYFVRSDFENLEHRLVSMHRIDQYLDCHIVYEVYEGYGPEGGTLRIGVDQNDEKLEVKYFIEKNKDGKSYEARYKAIKYSEIYKNTLDIYDGEELLQTLTWESDKCWRQDFFDFNKDGYLDTRLHISDGEKDRAEYDPLILYTWNPETEQLEEVISEETIRYGYCLAGKEKFRNWYRTYNSDAYFYREYRWEGNQLIKTAEGYCELLNKDDSPMEEENVKRENITSYNSEALQAGRENTKGAGCDYGKLQSFVESLISERPEVTPLYKDNIGSFVSRLDGRVISFETGYTFDAENGEELELTDIIEDDEAFWNAVIYSWIKYLDAEMTKAVERRWDCSLDVEDAEALMKEVENGKSYAEILEEILMEQDHFTWYMESNGIRFELKENTLARDSINCLISYGYLATGMKPEYLPGEGAMMGSLGYNCMAEFEPGKMVFFEAKSMQQSKYGWNPCLFVNGQEYSLVMEGDRAYSYVLKEPNGDTFLFVCLDYGSDDFSTFVFDITGGNINVCTEYEGEYFSILPGNFETVEMYRMIKMLGYRYGALPYTISTGGIWAASSNMFRIRDNLVVINQELPVIIDGVQSLLPIGTVIEVTETNGEDLVYFTIVQTGQVGEIHLETDKKDDKGRRVPNINGLPEYECLKPDDYDCLTYAG